MNSFVHEVPEVQQECEVLLSGRSEGGDGPQLVGAGDQSRARSSSRSGTEMPRKCRKGATVFSRLQ